MNQKEAARLIDISAVQTHHTLADIRYVVDVAKRFSFMNVHSLPAWTRTVRDMLRDTPHILAGAPVGFPGGGHTTSVKLFEAEKLIEDGVQEMDIVMNVGRFKSEDYEYVLGELNRIVDLTPKAILTKVIIEINVLTDEEIMGACDLIMQTDADFIKTGTGWVQGSLNLARIAAIKRKTQGRIKLKVAGGVRAKEDFEYMCGIGVERFGINTQAALNLIQNYAPAS